MSIQFFSVRLPAISDGRLIFLPHYAKIIKIKMVKDQEYLKDKRNVQEELMEISILSLSIGCLVLTSLLAFLAPKRIKSSKQFKPIYILLAGAVTSCFILMLKIDYQPSTHGANTTLFLALLHSVQVMFLGYDFDLLYSAISISSPYASFAYFYISFLFFLTPIYTFSFVLSFFESVTSYFRYVIHWRSDIYILSEPSEKTLVLAKSIREKFPNSTIAFMNVPSEDTDTLFSMKEEANEWKFLLFRKGITDVGLKLHTSKSKAVFFAIHDNETANLEIALKLIQRFSKRSNTELYVFSTSNEGEFLLDSIKKDQMRVRRVNKDRSLAYSIISQYPITDHYTLHQDRKIISTLIVGFGGYGTELAKALLWCGQLPDYDLEINIIDKNPDTESHFRAICPEIKELNENNQMGEAKYNIHFYNGVDVRTHQFHQIVSGLSNTSVVYVSLGNDERNIETAITLRILLERIGICPIIRAIVYSDIKTQALEQYVLRNHQGTSYDIEIIGNMEARFSYDTIVNEELEKTALACHLRWANTPEEKENAIRQFNEYEYFRNSSAATAIHEQYRAAANLSEKVASVIEHMRWNAYMRTEGYVFSGSCDQTSRNDRAKMHHNLHGFGSLAKEDVEKDKRIAYQENATINNQTG